MADKGISIAFAADVGKFLSGTKDIEGALDQVGGSLDDLAREAQDAGEKAGQGLGEGVTGGAQDAEKAVRDIDLDAVADDAKKAGDDAGRGIGDGVREGADEADKAVRDIDFGTVADDAKDAGDEAGKGLKDGIEDGAKKAEDAFEDVEKAAKSELGKVEDHAKDAGSKVESAAEDVEKKFRDTWDDVSRRSKQAGDDVGKNVKAGFDKAGEGASEFKDEAASTAREGAASFTGEFDDVADVIQETLANAFVGFGPAGAAAGLAAAAGIGILIGSLQNSAEKAAEAKDRVIELASEIREAGGDLDAIDWGAKIQEWGEQIVNAKSWWEVWQEAPVTAFEETKKAAEEFGLSYSTLAQGMAGDSEAAAEAMAEIEVAIERETEKYEALVADGVDPATAAMMTQTGGLEDLRGKLEEAGAQVEQAIELEGLHEEALRGSEAAIVDYNDQMREKLDLLKESAEENMSAAEAEAEWAQKVMESDAALQELNEMIDTSTQSTKDQTDAVKNGGAELDLYTEAGQFANEKLIDLADSAWNMVDAAREQGASTDELRTKTEAARTKFIETATQMGLTEGAARALADEYGLIPSEVSTTAVMHTGDAMSRLRALDSTLNSIDGRTVTAYAAIAQYGQGAMNSGGQVPKRAASGTYIAAGPGSDIDDRVPTLLSPGEFVLDRQATDQIGVGNLQALNEGQRLGAGGGPQRVTGEVTLTGPIDLSEASVSAIAEAVLAGAQKVGVETARQQRIYQRTGAR